MAYITAVTVSVTFDAPNGISAFLGASQSIEAFRFGIFRMGKRECPFTLRALLAPVTLHFPSEGGSMPDDELTFTCAPNESEIDSVSPSQIAEAYALGAAWSKGDSAVFKNVMLSDPGGLITIESGKTPGLLAIDSDPDGPYYRREAVSLDTYHQLLYRNQEGGPRLDMVEEMILPKFWKRDANGRFVTFNIHSMAEERVSPLELPVSLMKADEFMDEEDAFDWSERVVSDFGSFKKLDVIFGYASAGSFTGKTDLFKAEDLGKTGFRPVTQLVATPGPYLPEVLGASNRRVRNQVTRGGDVSPSLV